MAAKTPDTPLGRYIAHLVKEHGTATRLAAKIPMSLSAFSRAVHEEGTFSFENCLRLAAAAGDKPGRILRLANKQDQADLVERLFSGNCDQLSSRARRLAHGWETFCDTKTQDGIELLVDAKRPSADDNPGPDASASAQRLPPLEVYRVARGLSYHALAKKVSAAAGFPRSADCIRKFCLGQTTAQGPTAWAVDKFLNDEKTG